MLNLRLQPVLVRLFIYIAAVSAVNNGLARTPVMGWNTWNRFVCGINEELILSSAKLLVSTGLKDAGYNYVNVDDCWHAPERASDGSPAWDPNTFPRGIKALADDVHDLGLKFGIYSSAGTMTCQRRFGSLGYEEIDAKAYAEWGVDLLKYDNCFNDGLFGNETVSYAKMANALNATGRPIVYSMCNWGQDLSWTWAGKIANMWRMSGDISDDFDGYDSRCPCLQLENCTEFGYYCSAVRILDWAAAMLEYSEPGAWNDLDMLEAGTYVGNGGMSYDEYVSHFSLWALVKSPLILGNDLAQMSDETLEIITNDAIIAANQDPLGVPAKRVWKRDDLELWAGPLHDGSTVVAVLNTADHNQTIDLEFSDLPSHLSGTKYTAYDLWQKADDSSSSSELKTRWGRVIGAYEASIPSVELKLHQTRVFKIVPEDDVRKFVVQVQ
ncbi:glycoside hydrolase [Punctularia strigosozonata HHB-11173 SS5]|uniref:glycoside hydrolase n=1 Tax=Punctularia strigosozonata (strain HHB-11173) TaxID=741275 RepID=UPI0004416835|nr:glycoside hydrolase [Punctularia strigosozonata HHB-11173 SS5]EIN11230.1 glycoside hydrolase [Punctularia strigosozonata HHB-11173 SS5]